jgi:hypothetical protein
MAWNEVLFNGGKISLHDVKVSAADAASENAKQQVRSFDLRAIYILDFEKTFRRGMRCCKNGGFHLVFVVNDYKSTLVYTPYQSSNLPRSLPSP